jgi:2-dehydropantoate 2-reductase
LNFNNALQKLKVSLILPLAIKKHRAITSGMLRDLDRGRLCEIGDINGVVCAWGKKYNVPTPVSDRIVEIVHSIERGERKYGAGNLVLMGGV